MGATDLWRGIKFAGIGARAATLNMVNRDASRQYLLQTLGAMPGLPAKASQLLAMKMGVSFDPHVKAAPLPLPEVKYLLESRHPSLASLIDTLDPEPLVASLGQVHAARLKDGREVAIKIQFPDLDEEFPAQLGLLLKTAAWGPAGRYGMDWEAYRSFLMDRLGQELDYRREAAAQQNAASLNEQTSLVIPSVLTDLSTDKILVQSWEGSQPLVWMLSQPEEERRQAGIILLRFFLSGLFRHGLLHTDLHPGNIGFRCGTQGVEVVLYDFGSTVLILPEHRLALLKLVQAYDGGTPVVPRDVLVYLGFADDKLSYVHDQLPSLCGKFVEPLLHPRAWVPGDWDLQAFVTKVLAGDAWWFRTAGPPWFLYLMKAVHGLTHVLGALQVPLPLRREYLDVVATQQADLQGFTVPPSPHRREMVTRLSSDCARTVKVRVAEGGRELVFLEFPVRVVDELEAVIPADVRRKLEEDGTDLLEIKAQCQRRGYLPQVLFEAVTPGKSYRVWLE